MGKFILRWYFYYRCIIWDSYYL